MRRNHARTAAVVGFWHLKHDHQHNKHAHLAEASRQNDAGGRKYLVMPGIWGALEVLGLNGHGFV